jgi:hypothetical protein
MAGVVHANVVYTVSLDTSAISGAADYALGFSFQDGSLTGDNNNTVTLSNFAFGGGSAGGSPVLVGGASGDISSTATLSDTDFSNLLVEGFTPGASLSFRIDLTTNVDAGGIPDFFGFSILLNGISLPTQDDTLGDNLLYFNIDSVNPTPAAWATTAESPATLDAPTVALAPPPGSLPEPGGLLLLTAGLASLLMFARRRL